MFLSMKELIEESKTYKSVAELMITQEIEYSGATKEEIQQAMYQNLNTMKSSVQEGIAGVKSTTGLTGGDATKLNQYIEQNTFLSGETILKAVRNAVATNEVNAKMGLICATPTAGSAGVLAGVLCALSEKLHLSEQQEVDFLFTAGAFGLVIGNNASISGAEGGCQAEVGSAAAMGAAAIVLTRGGTVEQAVEAVAICLKNMLGLVCDPVAGLVEVPCVKRNALGASQAFISADMALAGVTSVIPCDEVIDAMYRVGESMSPSLKETAEGGLATTPTGLRLKKEIFGDQQ